MFCSACGTKNEATAKFCQSCGAALGAATAAPGAATAPPIPPDPGTIRGAHPTQVATAAAPTAKNPVLAAILSVLIVGVGQFYNGDIKKGAVMLGGAVILAIPTAGLAWLGIAIWSAIDAYKVANGTGKMW